MTIAIYGGHTHLPGEVNLARMDYRQVPSPRGKRLAEVVTAYLGGELQGEGAVLHQACQTLIDAYSEDYRNFRLTTDAGVTINRHELINDRADNLSGVRVIHRSWAKGDAAELATKRTYSITLQAMYDRAESDLVHWQERLIYLGNTGPAFSYVPTFFGPRFYQTAAKTPQIILQSGIAVGWSGYVLPPGSLFGTNEHPNQREVELISGRNLGQAVRYFTTKWTYRHTFSEYQELFPVSK